MSWRENARDHAAVGGDRSRQDVHDRQPQRYSPRSSVFVDRRARIRLHRRAFGLWQEHVPAYYRRLRACERRCFAVERTADRPPGSRSRHDVSGAFAISLAHRHRERRMAARDEGIAETRAYGQGGRISRSRSSFSFRRSLSRPTERRNETARCPGTAVRPRSGNHAHGRAVRRARFPDPGIAAGGGVEGARAGGSVRINSASIQNWILPVAALAAWEILGRAGLTPRYLSTPSAILAALWEIALTGELFVALAASLYRVSVGF